MFVYAQQFICIGVFALSVLLASFFTKNMIARLVVAMVICNIVCVSSENIEGFRGKGVGEKIPGLKHLLKALEYLKNIELNTRRRGGFRGKSGGPNNQPQGPQSPNPQ
jgi:hypothetical protein